jgi:protease-4
MNEVPPPVAPEVGATPSAAAQPQAPAEPSAAPVPPTPDKPKKSRKGCWVAFGVTAAVLLVLFGVVLPIVIAVSIASGSKAPGFKGAIGGGNVAVIRINGIIASSGDSGLFASSTTGPEDILEQIHDAEDDPDIKVILLRIDSPGGVASAGQEIAQAVRDAKKPVVASIADTGASAAYMIASQADHIISAPGSLVGSIGVIMEIPNYEGLYEKLGIKVVTLTSGKFKDIGNPARPMTAEEKAVLMKQIRIIYDQFVDDVAEGRDMPEAEVRKLATGLFWTGTEAEEMGLIDEVGNYDDALAAAAKLGNIKGRPRVQEMREQDFWDVFSQSLAESMVRAARQGTTVKPAAPTTR